MRDKGFAIPHIYGETRAGGDVRHRLRDGRGPPVLHRRPAPRRARAALLVRRRLAGEPRHGPRASGWPRPTPRTTSSRRSTAASDLYGAGGQQLERRRRELHRGDQRLHQRGQAQSAEDARRVRGDQPPAGPRRLEDLGPGSDRGAGRRRSSARAGAGSSSPRCCARSSTSASARRASRAGATSARPTIPRPPPRSRAGRSRTGCRRRSPSAAPCPTPGPSRWRRPSPALRFRPRPATATPASSAVTTASRACAAHSRAARRTRCWSPAASRHRATARRLRPAGLLFRAADPDGAGDPRARRSTPAARRSRAPTSTSSSGAGATTRGRRPRPARTSSTPSPFRCARRAAARRR